MTKDKGSQIMLQGEKIRTVTAFNSIDLFEQRL